MLPVGFSGRELAIGADSVGVFKDQMVDLLLNSDVYGTTIGSQLQLPSNNPMFSRPLVVTAEMLHSRIRCRLECSIDTIVASNVVCWL